MGEPNIPFIPLSLLLSSLPQQSTFLKYHHECRLPLNTPFTSVAVVVYVDLLLMKSATSYPPYWFSYECDGWFIRLMLQRDAMSYKRGGIAFVLSGFTPIKSLCALVVNKDCADRRSGKIELCSGIFRRFLVVSYKYVVTSTVKVLLRTRHTNNGS